MITVSVAAPIPPTPGEWQAAKQRPTCFGDNKNYPEHITRHQFATALFRRRMHDRAADRVASQYQGASMWQRAKSFIARKVGR